MSWSHPAFEELARWLTTRTGLCFAPARQESAEQGLRRAMARAGIADPAVYRQRIETEGRLLDDAIVELTVGETYFFREPAQFECLRREVLPEIRQRRGAGHLVRAWSAGCASGEEAYSLAILWEELGLAEPAHLLATDISRAALARARTAVYGSWSLRGEGARFATPYLHQSGQGHALDERIRRRVVFEHLNLALDVYPSFATGTWGMDLILCRNVLIYFDRETIQRVARRLFESLAPGGWLLTAASDPPLASEAPFATVVTSAGVFYRRPLDRHLPEVERSAVLAPARAGEPLPSAAIRSPSREPPRLPRRSDREQLGRAPPAKTPSAPADPLAAACQAFQLGDYARAELLARGLPEDPAAGALRVRALANLESSRAERVCAEVSTRFPLSTELHYLHAVLLLELGRDEQAIQALRRVIYLDRSLAIAHSTLGSILWRHGDPAGARRAYRNAHVLSCAQPAEELLPLSDGEQAGRLAEAAAAQLAILDATQEATP